MNARRQIPALLVTIFLSAHVFRCDAQTVVVKPTLAEDLGKVWGYCESQTGTLRHIAKTFPSLKPAVSQVEAELDVKWGRAINHVSERLRQLIGVKWSEFEATLERKVTDNIQSNTNTESAAISYIRETKGRLASGMPSPIQELLVANDPELIANPALEIQKGFVNSFSTNGHPKSKSLNLTLKCPISWLREEGERPNIIQKWTSDNGHGGDVFLIIVKKLPAVPSGDEMADLFTEQSAKEMTGKNSTLVRFTKTKLESTPVGIVRFTQNLERLGVTTPLRGTMYYLISKDSMVLLQGICNLDRITSTDRDSHTKKLDSLFDSIVNTLVLEDRYK